VLTLTASILTDQIKANFDALALILVFVTVLFGIKYTEIVKDINKDVPDPARANERKEHHSRLCVSLRKNCIPILATTGVSWILLLPLFIHIVSSQTIHPWDQTITVNAYLFVATMTGVFFFWSVWLTGNIAKRIYESRPASGGAGPKSHLSTTLVLSAIVAGALALALGLYFGLRDEPGGVPSWIVSARAKLAMLQTADGTPGTGYSPNQFGSSVSKATTGRKRCNVRDEILARDLESKSLLPGGNCVVDEGILNDPYSDTTVRFFRVVVQIDHIVALKAAWRTGAEAWSAAERKKFARDPIELLAVSSSQNAQKRDRDAFGWVPRNAAYDCAYVATQIEIKTAYKLWVTEHERLRMEDILSHCPMGSAPPRNWRSWAQRTP
jgi:hypothetical protein